MSSDEVAAVLAAAEAIGPRAHLALRLAALTGARRSELAALRWDDVIDGRVRIDSSITTVRGGGAPPVFVDGPRKTANRRMVSLDQETLGLIRSLAADPGSGGQWMLAGPGREPDPDRIGAWWRAARTAAGIDRSWRLHDLRHWSATQAIGAGADVRTVAGRLGHANPAMTLRTSAHLVEASDRAVAETLSYILRSEEGRR